MALGGAKFFKPAHGRGLPVPLVGVASGLLCRR
jgi:hypothetical protein